MKDYEIHPAAEKYPLMTGAQWDAFVEDIRTNGQQVPIALLGGKIIDGRQRYKALQQIGRKPKFVKLPKSLTPEIVALSLNIHRRHLTKEERETLIIHFRKNGDSLRTIAEKVGASEATVRRAVATASNDAVALPEKVKGKDGKERSAKVAPKQEAEPDESEPETPFSKAHDQHGKMRELATELQRIKQEVIRYSEDNPYLSQQAMESAFASIIHDLRVTCAPFKDCPRCDGKGCKACRNVGWMSKFQFNNLPKD